MKDEEGEAARVRAALDAMEGRSPLYDWLRQHRVLLEARFAVSRPRWAAVAKVLSDLGVRDAAGRSPTAGTARQAWYRVRSGPVTGTRPAPVPVLTSRTKPAPDAVPQSPAPAHFDPMEGAFDPKPPPRFKPASLK